VREDDALVDAAGDAAHGVEERLADDEVEEHAERGHLPVEPEGVGPGDAAREVVVQVVAQERQRVAARREVRRRGEEVEHVGGRCVWKRAQLTRYSCVSHR